LITEQLKLIAELIPSNYARLIESLNLPVLIWVKEEEVINFVLPLLVIIIRWKNFVGPTSRLNKSFLHT
jgi:hypothetical protein